MSPHKQSRRVSPITLPTSCTDSEPTTSGELTTIQQEDLLLAKNYFERIGRREKIHEVAVEHHLKGLSAETLDLVITTFGNLQRSRLQTPPPLLPENIRFDVKAAIARGRELAFAEYSAEAEHAWAYGYAFEGAECASPSISPVSPRVEMPAGEREDPLDIKHTAWDANEAKLALEHIQNLVHRLVSKDTRLDLD
ncbi:hypothetical protein C8F04DRAFT_1250863 [Mycena alexandri]|uniref:Uncharacterized protein n=1 Tax=Mycena alexandri TaxID=1745969 RepID=A0AAD6TE58_9AGAR|nr:hypothetical protein C8F04DRAFT_1250853 [Mycena alexandri]KAJ7043435.1 hypothetical protein C8F04DRAFT_1250863 [Mycena alexandri]